MTGTASKLGSHCTHHGILERRTVKELSKNVSFREVTKLFGVDLFTVRPVADIRGDVDDTVAEPA